MTALCKSPIKERFILIDCYRGGRTSVAGHSVGLIERIGEPLRHLLVLFGNISGWGIKRCLSDQRLYNSDYMTEVWNFSGCGCRY